MNYFDDKRIVVLGVSFDSVDELGAFAKKFNFNFRLLSDADRRVAVAFGACGDASARHPERVSFLIDERGVIERAYDRVDPRDHAARVLADLQQS